MPSNFKLGNSCLPTYLDVKSEAFLVTQLMKDLRRYPFMEHNEKVKLFGHLYF